MNTHILVIDVKGEYTERFKRRGLEPITINPLYIKLCICRCSSNKLYFDLAETLSKVLSIPKSICYDVQKTIEYHCSKCIGVEQAIEILKAREIDYIEDIEKVLRFYEVCTSNSDCVDLRYFIRRHPLTIIDLSSISDEHIISILAYSIIESIFRSLPTINTDVARYIVVLDEAWQTIPHQMKSSIPRFFRLARSKGIAMFIASQTIQDFEPQTSLFIESAGLFIAFSNPSPHYWKSISRYVELGSRSMKNAMSLAERGTGIARFLPNRKPFFVYIDIA